MKERSFNASSAVVSESICAGGERVLRHLQALCEGTRLLNFCRDVIRKRVLHSRQEHQLRDRLAADAAEFRRKILRLLDAGNFVTRRAAVIGNQVLTVRDLLRSRSFKMNIGAAVRNQFSPAGIRRASRLEHH